MYYVYFYLREDRTPYYVGKGKGYRAFARHSGCIQPPTDRIRIIMRECFSEAEAFEMEKFFILLYGRKHIGTGVLRNLTEGGEGNITHGMLGKQHSEETKLRIAAKKFGKTSPRKGVVLSIETRKKISESRKGVPASNKGVPFSVEARKKMSEAAKKRQATPEGFANSSRAGKIGSATRWGKKAA